MGGNNVDDASHENTKYGEPLQYDPDFNGPIKNRSCTDIICLILFILFFACWIVVAVLAFKYGEPEKLIKPTDSLGNICGEGNFTDKKYLLFFDLTKCTILHRRCDTPQICVEQCPQNNFFANVEPTFLARKLKDVNESEQKSKLYCNYDVNSEQTVGNLIEKNNCTRYILKSEPVVGRCIPLLSSLNDAVKETNKTLQNLGVKKEDFNKAGSYIAEMTNNADKIWSDLKNSWKLISVGLILAMIFCFLWIVLMRWLAWLMLWISILLVLAVLASGMGYSYLQYQHYKNQTTEDLQIMSIESYGKRKDTWLVLGIILSIIFLILILMIIFLRNRIRLAIALVEESSKAVGSVFSSLFFPIFPFILQLAVIAFGLVIAALISSASVPKHVVFKPPGCSSASCPYEYFDDCNDAEKFNNTCLCPDAKCVLFDYETNYLINGAHVFNLFLCFWTTFFVVGLGQMVLAGSFATWYWAYDKSNLPTFVVATSFYRTIRYHLGSIAFGSLLIAIVKLIRAMLEYADRKLKEYTENPIAKCIMCCLKCCFWCLENFIKFISRNAYIMVAIYGRNFCSSAREAFQLLMRNILRVVVLDKVTDFLLFLGKLTIVGCMGLLAFATVSGKVKGTEVLATDLNFIAIPIAIICIGSYIIASFFFNVYSMAVDTLFLCFLEDCEMNDGSAQKPYRMSKNLMKILGKKNKKLVDPDDK